MMKFEQKIAKFAFLKKSIFGIFGVAKISKKSNHQKCENLVKRCRIFIASFQRRVLNTIFGPPEPSRKNFFPTIKMLTRQNFHFLQKTMEKLMFLQFLKSTKLKNHDFPLGFSIKMSWDKIPEIKFFMKINRKLPFLHFS